MNDVLPEPNWVAWSALTMFGYCLPFAAFYLGILLRYEMRSFFVRDVLTRRQMNLMGILFSVVTVSPLLPSFIEYCNPSAIPTYLVTMGVVIQAGFFMPEALARIIEDRNHG